MRADERAALHELLARTLDANDGSLPGVVAAGVAKAHGLSVRQVRRHAQQVLAAHSVPGTTDAATEAQAEGEDLLVADPALGQQVAWWDEGGDLHRVLTAVAGADTLKAAWRLLNADGTVETCYSQFTRDFRTRITPSVAAAVAGDGREAYLRTNIYCVDQQPHRNGRWQADCQQVPVWVRGDRGQAPFKPWQITFLDEATRMVMASILIAGNPTQVDTTAAIAVAVRGHQTEDGMFVGGIPDSLRWDNGGEFINGAVTDVCVRLMIVPRPSAPYAAFQKGKIERWHESIQAELYATLPGASDGPRTFTGRQPWRGDDHQLMTFTALSMLMADWVRAYNTERVHSSLRSTPAEAWRTNTNPLRLATAAQLHPLMLQVPKTRVVGKDGISFQNVHYLAPELRRYARRRVSIRILPGDLDTIAVFDGDVFVCTAVRAEQLTAQQRKDLVRARHEDYRVIKTATAAAAAARRQDAIIRQVLDPAAAVAIAGGGADAGDLDGDDRTGAGVDLVPNDEALIDLLGDPT